MPLGFSGLSFLKCSFTSRFCFQMPCFVTVSLSNHIFFSLSHTTSLYLMSHLSIPYHIPFFRSHITSLYYISRLSIAYPIFLPLPLHHVSHLPCASPDHTLHKPPTFIPVKSHQHLNLNHPSQEAPNHDICKDHISQESPQIIVPVRIASTKSPRNPKH